MAEISSNALNKTEYTPFDIINCENAAKTAFSCDTSYFESILSCVSDSNFNDDTWLVSVPEYHVQKKLNFTAFNTLNPQYINLVKCWSINMLGMSYSLSNIKLKLSKSAVFLNYLHERNIRLSSVRITILELFLKNYEDNPALHNNFSVAISDLLDFSAENGANFSEHLFCPVLNNKIESVVRRAPDACVMESLDRLFFTDKEIPADMRCAYLLMRLILNRISEVLNMSLDCIIYPQEGIYTVCIPTQKETPFHRPCYSKYSRSLEDYYTARLYEAIQMQKEYALSRQKFLPEELKNYLFVSSSDGTRLLTAAEFNTFLAELCTERKIYDADGNIAKLSSHHLRHAGITDRLQSVTISAEQTMKEANHSSLSTTMGYGYSSCHDEAQHNKEIVKNVFTASYDTRISEVPQTVNPRKYKALQQNPFVRVVPALGLCTNLRCKPRFEECINCSHFTPDSHYKEYFEECAAMSRERLQKLAENPARNEAAIAFNRERLTIYEKYIERIAYDHDTE